MLYRAPLCWLSQFLEGDWIFNFPIFKTQLKIQDAEWGLALFNWCGGSGGVSSDAAQDEFIKRLGGDGGDGGCEKVQLGVSGRAQLLCGPRIHCCQRLPLMFQLAPWRTLTDTHSQTHTPSHGNAGLTQWQSERPQNNFLFFFFVNIYFCRCSGVYDLSLWVFESLMCVLNICRHSLWRFPVIQVTFK